jgi:branched-chain amino acid transport system permease protein
VTPSPGRCAADLSPSGRGGYGLHPVLFIVVEQIVNGLVVGAYYILLALGLSLVFSLGGIVNLAHGAFYALGAYLAVTLANAAGFYGALVAAPVAVAVVGMAIEALFLRRLYHEEAILGLLFTFGLALTTEQVIRLIWGVTGLPFWIPPSLGGVLRAGGFLFSNYRLAVLAVAIAAIACTWLLLYKTSFGMVVRAGTSDPEMVRALGIRLRPVLTIIFGLGVGIAGLAGVMSAPLAGVQPAMGTEILTATFVIVVIGGLGSFWGVVLAALLVGVVRGITIHFVPAAGEASIYVLMFLVLLLRPRGLLGERIEKFE